MRKKLSNNEMRRLVQATDLLILLDKYRYEPDTMSELDKELVYFGVSEFVLTLANKHYKRRQKSGHHSKYGSRQWYESIQANDIDSYQKQCNRIDMFFQFLKENKGSTRAILYMWHRRFTYLEMLIELKQYNISLGQDDETIAKRANNTLLSVFILGNRLARNYREREKKEPTLHDILKELIKYLVSKGKFIRYSYLKKFESNYRTYQLAKHKGNPFNGFEESLGNGCEDEDTW